MQVHHEAHLLETGPLRAEDFNGPGRSHQWSHASKCLDYYVLLSQSNSLNSIEHMVCSPTNNLLAILMSQTNQIYFYDTRTRTRLERFPLKPCDKKFSRQSFQVTGMDFSPDGQRLAVGQTDCIIYIYKLPAQLVATAGQPSSTSPSNASAGDQPKESFTNSQTRTASLSSKPTITGKFTSSSPITCLIWSEVGIIFGGQDGKVRLISSSLPGQVSSKATGETPSAARLVSVIFVSPRGSMPVLLAYKWPLLCIGFIDASVELMLVGELQTLPAGSSLEPGTSEPTLRRSSSQMPQVPLTPVFSHLDSFGVSSPPAGLLIIQTPSQTTLSISLASSDGQVSFHDFQQQTGLQQSGRFDLKEDIQSLDYSHVNEVLAVLTRNRIYFVKYEQQQPQLSESSGWRIQGSTIELGNVFCLTKVCWLRDGTQLALGASNGSVELFRCSWTKQTIGDQLDICHIAKNRIRITDRERNLLATYKTPQDIKRVNLLDNGQSVIIWTHGSSVLLARLGQWSPQQQSLIKLASLLGPQQASSSRENRSALKFLFEPSGFVFILVPVTRELHVLRLGESEPAYSIKFGPNEPIRRQLIAARQCPWPLMMAAQMSQRLSSAETLSPTSRQKLRDFRTGSAKSTQALGDMLDPLGASLQARASINDTSPLQLLAFVRAKRQLTVIELKLPTKSKIFEREWPDEIGSIEFSHTGRYLVCRDLARGQLLLIEFTRSNGDSNGVCAAERSSISRSEFASWICGTDSLVIQQGHKVLIWYDLGESLKRAEQLDTRKLNPNLLGGPSNELIDLSFVGAEPDCKLAPNVVRATQEQVVLSNGQALQLDELLVRFYAELAANQLGEAANLLLAQIDESHKSVQHKHRSLMGKLGWLAIEKDECELALRVFSKLEHKSMCTYLLRCLDQQQDQRRRLMLAKLCGAWDKFEQLALDQDEISSSYRRMNRWLRLIAYLERAQQFRQRDLAEQELQSWLLLRGRRVEASRRLASVSGQLVKAIEMLMQYDDEESAQIGDETIDKRLLEASRLLLERPQRDDKSLDKVAQRLYEALLDRKLWARAAELAERALDKPAEAVDLYMRSKNFKTALSIATKLHARAELDEKKVQEIQLAFAEHLENLYSRAVISKRRVTSAINLYERAGHPVRALRLAGQLKATEELSGILSNLVGYSHRMDDEMRHELQKLASSLLKERNEANMRLACKALELAADYEHLVQALLESDQVERAFRVSLEHLNDNDKSATLEYFSEYAKRLLDQVESMQHEAEDAKVRQTKLKSAELIYVQLAERPGMAIEMYKRFEMWDEAVTLLELHQSDQLEATLLQLARQFETRGQLDEAEKWLLKASPSEWTNVVRMYRLAERWPDAYRVAQANCISEQDPLLVQLAYWWAKSMVSNASVEPLSKEALQQRLAEARALLKDKLRVHKQVIEFCCELKNFQFALDLCSQSDDETALRREVALRYANFLEQQHKFAKAEQVLLECDLVELAVRMYVDNDQLQEAVRLIESKLSELADSGQEQSAQLLERLHETLIDCANRLASECSPIGGKGRGQSSTSDHRQRATVKQERVLEKLAQAQQLLLRAQRPDLAIEMYKERGLWQEAIQVAQRFAPRLLEQVEQALDEQVEGDLGSILRVPNVSQAPPLNGDRLDQRSDAGNSVQSVRTQNQGPKSLVELLATGDWRAARSSLLDLIEQARERGESAMGKLDKSLTAASAQPNQVLGQLLASQPEIVEQICSMARAMLRSNLLHENDLKRYKQLRNVLAITAKLIWRQQTHNSISRRFGSPGDGASSDETWLVQLDQGVLISHLFYLHLCLQQYCMQHSSLNHNGPGHMSISQVERIFGDRREQPSDSKSASCIDLLSKLSLSMINYAGDWLAPTQVIYWAGLWQLAAGRRRLARSVFSLLIELIEHANRSETEALLSRRGESWTILGKFVDLPQGRLGISDESSSAQQQIATETRQWLLKTLIEGTSDEKTEPMLQYDAKQRPDCATCVVSGLPVALGSAERKIIGVVYERSFETRSSEWNTLLTLAGQHQQASGKKANKSPLSRRPDSLLSEIAEFLQILSND